MQENILFATRPTAVNLGWGLEKIMNVAKTGETARTNQRTSNFYC